MPKFTSHKHFIPLLCVWKRLQWYHVYLYRVFYSLRVWSRSACGSFCQIPFKLNWRYKVTKKVDISIHSTRTLSHCYSYTLTRRKLSLLIEKLIIHSKWDCDKCVIGIECRHLFGHKYIFCVVYVVSVLFMRNKTFRYLWSYRIALYKQHEIFFIFLCHLLQCSQNLILFRYFNIIVFSSFKRGL